MSTTDPTGEGGGGGESATTPSTNVEQGASPVMSMIGTTVPPSSQQQHPPPSPLSGCYLLVVLPEPHTAQHKDLILNRLAKGFLSWDKDSCHVDLEKELQALVLQAPEGEEARNGERLIQYATENLVTEVLIHPQTNTLLQCIRNLLASFTKHRHIIHAGYTFGGNGSWILQDGTFSLADFLDAFSEHEVQRVLRAYENSVTVDIHCAGVGDWTTNRLSKEACTRSCRVRVNPDDVLTAGVPAITSFTNYIGQYLMPQTLDQLMEPSDVVGNIRFSHPTLYVFPGGQGDAALFGINGFNMLVDGGFARKACFWDFTRHLDRLDAVLVTRVNNSNIGGISSVLQKKKQMHVYPQIGHFFCNLVERRQSNSPDGDKDIDPLILNLTDIGQEMVVNLRDINLRAHLCYRDPDPINLYHKVGHGTLDMYVLSPSKDSREVREFLAKWHSSDSKLFAGSHKKDSNNLMFPIQNLVSICALLVWQPANPEDTITRILFPGSTPQHKIFEGFERLKHMDFLKHPVCSAKSLSPSTSLATLRDKPVKQKLSFIEKESKKVSEIRKERKESPEMKTGRGTDESTPKATPQSTPIIPTKLQSGKVEVKTKKVTENKRVETDGKESKKIEKDLKEVKKESKKVERQVEKSDKTEKSEKLEKRDEEAKKTEIIKSDTDKTIPTKEIKQKSEPKKRESKESKAVTKGAKVDTAPKPKQIEKKGRSPSEKKDTVKSSPTTPKKTLNGAATKIEISKTAPKAKPLVKAAPPAKSAKDANNRKVVEQKNIEKSGLKDTSISAVSAAKASAKPKPTDRKPISRRTKPVSPSKVRLPGSPAKSTRSTPTTSVKSDKDGVIRKVKGDKGTTDSSTVSTPSGIEPETVAKLTEKSLTEKSEDISLDSIESKVLADLKEEREVVEEIEAVLQKAERIEEARKDDRFEGDDEITAEVTDKKEEDITEEDITAEIEDAPKKSSRKESQELTEEDEYLIVEKEEIYTEDSAQSGEGEQKHVLDEAESEKAKILKDMELIEENGEKEELEEKEKDEKPEKKSPSEKAEIEEGKKITDTLAEQKELLQEEVKDVISATEPAQKPEEKDDSGKKDSEDITKEPSSLSPDKLDSSEKKTTDTDMKPEADQKEQVPEKLEESQERISTLESGATTTAPTLPEDERITLDEIKEDIDEKHVIEEVKEKDVPAKVKEEVVPQTAPPTAKPDVKVFDVRQAVQCLQRDIVKTPDEVADLPVHEEVDPKLYRMDDFEKDKDEKPSPAPQDAKEPPTPPVKEQKSVFSFFGKVADKFEKGIDKLTKKTKKDQEKDVDDKSSKSSSPKEAKPPEKTVLEDVDMEKMFPKVSKPSEKPEEEIEPALDDTKGTSAAFIQQEIQHAKRSSVSEAVVKEKVEEAVEKEKATTEETVEEVSKGVLSLKEEMQKKEDEEEEEEEKGIELLKEEPVEEDVEEVKALLEEASKKFKTVKDSLRDSLESLEEKIADGIPPIRHELPPVKDAIKDTLEGVAEKLEEIKPHIESTTVESKEPEKVKFDISKDEEFEREFEDDSPGPLRDVKGAVRDVGEVLAGTAGIVIEEKPKDVIEIVKKVAEVLKEDDFLSDKALFEEPAKKEEISSITVERKPSISEDKSAKLEDKPAKFDDIAMPRKVGITEEFSQEEVEELIEGTVKPLLAYETPGAVEVHEEPCVKVVKEIGDITSPRDEVKDKHIAHEICEELMQEDHVCKSKHSTPEEPLKEDVLKTGIESVCVKEVAKHRSDKEESEEEIEEPVIGFEQKVSPAKAEIVMVSPGSTPTSPKFASIPGLQELPTDVKTILDKEDPVEAIIEELIVSKKKKITIEIIEYITVVKRIPRERVIYIIEEIIIKRGLRRESIVDDVDILKLEETITPQKRMELEDYIMNEYVNRRKTITIEIIEEISIKKIVPKMIVFKIIEEIIIKRKISRIMVLDCLEEELAGLEEEEEEEEEREEEEREEEEKEEEIKTARKTDESEKRKSIVELHMTKEEEKSPLEEKEFEMKPEEEPEEASLEEDMEEDKLVDGFVSIPRRVSREAVEVKEKEVSSVKLDKIKSLREHEKDVTDDFEAVEQEYKVRDVPVTSPDATSRSVSEKLDEAIEKGETEEALEDTISDVVEADEKFVQETKEKVEIEEPAVSIAKDVKVTESAEELKKLEDITTEVETSEISDTNEKYLDEAKEKIDIKVETKSPIVEEIEKAKEPITEKLKSPHAELEEEKREKDSDKVQPTEKESPKETKQISEALTAEKTPEKEKVSEVVQLVEEKLEKEEVKPSESKPAEKPETKLADATGRAAEPIVTEDKSPEEPTKGIPSRKESIQEDVKDKVQDIKEKSPVHEVEVTPSTQMKIGIDKISREKPSKLEEDSGIVRRMLVTASSEDGGHETEICPTGSITFTKTVTPDDSLKDVSLKSSPDKDSLVLDKDSLHSGISTPERDSICDKSMPETKGLGKVTPEDSLDKSPGDRRDSQDLEDSLEKMEISKSKDVERTSPSVDAEISKSAKKEGVSPDEVKIIAEIATEKKIERSESPEKEPSALERVPVTDEEAKEKPKSSTEKVDNQLMSGVSEKPKSPDEKPSVDTEKSAILEIKDASPKETTSVKSLTEKPEVPKVPSDQAAISTEEITITSSEAIDKEVVQKDTRSLSIVSDKGDEKKPSTTPEEKISDASLDKKADHEIKTDIMEHKEKTKSPVPADDKVEEKVFGDKLPEKSRSPSVASDKSDRAKSPSIASDKSDEKEPMDRSKSPSIAGDKAEDIIADKSRSPSIITEKETSDLGDKPRSPSIVSDKTIAEETVTKSRSPSIAGDQPDDVPGSKKSSIAGIDQIEQKDIIDKSRSPSIAGDASTIAIKSKSPLGEKPPEQELQEKETPSSRKQSVSEKAPVEKSKSPSESSKASEEGTPDDKSRSPSVISEKLEEKPLDASKPPSIVDEKEIAADKSRSPSIEAGSLDGTEPTAKSPSAVSDESDDKKHVDHSKSPSLIEEKPDLKDVTDQSEEESKQFFKPIVTDKSRSPSISDKIEQPIGKDRSPSVCSVKSEQKSPSERSRSSSIAVEQVELMESSVAKSRSSSIVSVTDAKEALEKIKPSDKSRSPSLASDLTEQKGRLPSVDLGKPKEKEEPVDEKLDSTEFDKSRSASIASVTTERKESIDALKLSSTSEQKDSADESKSPSVPDKMEDITQKSISPVSDTSKLDDKIDRSKSPSVTEEKPDIKDLVDKSRSSSIASIVVEKKEPIDKAKSPTPDDKVEEKESIDRSRSSSIVAEKIEAKDIAESIIDKSRSASVISIADDHKESADRSKTPSIAGEKVDLQSVCEPETAKSRSSSIVSIAAEIKEHIDDVKPDEHVDRSKSPSVVSDKSDEKKSTGGSRSSSPPADKSDLKEASKDQKSRSSSIASTAADQAEVTDKLKSPALSSVTDEKVELKDVSEHSAELQSPGAVSVTSEPKVASPEKQEKQEEAVDRSRSQSLASVTTEHKEPVDRSRSPSIAGEKPDAQEVESVIKSRSSSVISIPGESKEAAERSKSPSIAGEKPNLKEVLEEPLEKSKSPSIASIASEKEPLDGSKSPSVAGDKTDMQDVMEQSFEKIRSLSITEDKTKPSTKSPSPTLVDELIARDKSRSSSLVSDKHEDKKSAAGTKSPSISGDKADLEDVAEQSIDKSRSTSPSVVSISSDQKDHLLGASGKEQFVDALDKSPTPSIPDEIGITDKPRSLSITSDKQDVLVDSKDDKSQKTDVSDAKSSRSVSPMGDKTPKDRSRSHSLYDTGEKTPLGRSRAASVYEDKLIEKVSIHDEIKSAFAEVDMKKPFDQKEKSPSKEEDTRRISIASTKLIEKDLGIMDAGEKEMDRSQTAKTEKSEDEEDDDMEDDIIKVTAEKKADIEKYIIEEYVTKKKKITKIVIETIVMAYSVPQFVVMDIIESVIAKEKVRRDSVLEFIEKRSETPVEVMEEEEEEEVEAEETLDPSKKIEIEKYVTDEFITKNKKITSKIIEEISSVKVVPRTILLTIIEEIISKRKIPRSSVIDEHLEESHQKDEKPGFISLDSKRFSVIKSEYPESTDEPRDSRKPSTDGKISPLSQDHFDRDRRSASKSPSFSPDHIASDKSTQDSPVRSEPHIDEEISISEEKRSEIEKLLETEYITKGKKITEVILEEIIIRTSLPRYIILEIVEEIILKKKLSRESVIDVEIYQDDEPDDSYERDEFRFEKSPEPRYELIEDGTKSSYDYKAGYPESDDRQQLSKSVTDYPVDYESQFHKAFVGGMTEIRTTHITTLSGKSTPDFVTRDGTPDSISEPTASTVERVEDKSGSKVADHISPDKPTASVPQATKVSPTEAVETKPVVTILKESKIGESESFLETSGKSEDESAIGKAVTKREVVEGDGKSTMVGVKQEESGEQIEIITKTIKEETVEQAKPEIIVKTIKREIVEEDEPEVITKVVKREIVEQDEPEIIKKVVKREIIISDSDTGDKKPTEATKSAVAGELPEILETITTKTTKTIITEELPDMKSDAKTEISTGADVKRIVTTVTTITEPDGKVTMKKDVKESIETVDSEELLDKLIDLSHDEKITTITTETTKTSDTPAVDKVLQSVESVSSTPDIKKLETADKCPMSPLVRDVISDDRSYSGKSSPDVTLPKDMVHSGSTGKSTPDISGSPLIRDGGSVYPQMSGRSTPDRRSEGRSMTATPEGFRSGEVMRTIITTTKSLSDDGEIITTTREVTESTNEKGETIVLTEKTDVKVDERLPSKDTAESAIRSIIGSIKSDVSSKEEHGPGSPQTHSDDEPPKSLLSSTSRDRKHSSEASPGKEEEIEFSAAAMSSSFYGELPAVPPQISAMKTFEEEAGMHKSRDHTSQGDYTFKKFTVEKEYAGSYEEKPDVKKYVDDADLDFDKALMESKEKDAAEAFSTGVSPRYTNGSFPQGTSDGAKDESKDTSKGDSKKDPLDDWGSPLGLPSPKPPRKFNLKNPAQSSSSSEINPDSLNFDVISDWGEPLRLPSPAPVTNEVSNKGAPGTPKKEKKQTKKVLSENMKNKKRSESPGKNEKKIKDSKNKVQPVYMDLTYVPHHGNSYYTSLEFFKRVRARYYVFSGTEPSREVYDALLEAKKTWEDKDLEVTMIPTYDTDTLGYWVADNEEALAANHIDLSPSASRCTINLQDHETSCSAYRLEF